MGYVGGGNISMHNHTLSQQYLYSNNGDFSSGNGYINSHTLSKCNYSSTFKYMDGYFENGDVSSGCGSMNIYTVYQQNGFQSLIKYNDNDGIDMNAYLHNGDVSSRIGLINIHTISQFNEPSNLDEMNWGVENVDFSGGRFYINIHTLSEAKNHNSIYYTNKRDKTFPSIYEI